MPWVQAHIRVPRAHSGRAEALLETLGALSVTLEDAADQPLLEPKPGETPLWDTTVVTGLFDAAVDTGTLNRALDQGMDGLASEIRVDTLEDQPWERAWMDHFHPMRFGKRLWICPHGQSLPEDAVEPVVLHLDPGLAFGTGTHPTTALCLEWLDGTNLRGKSVVDFGCGSGVLGIAALLLGARQVFAVDHDPQAVRATLDNARDNGVADRLTACLPGAAPGEVADLVLANILAGTLIELAGPLCDSVKPGGALVLSGILDDQADAVAAAFSPRIAFRPIARQDGWVLLWGIRMNMEALNES
jgi:ribosomal protein L11 methyltransferase